MLNRRSQPDTPAPPRPRGRRKLWLLEWLVLALIVVAGVLLLLSQASYIPGDNSPVSITHHEIRQLTIAAENFKSKFGVYPPSRVKLSETGNYPERDRPGTLDADSVALLGKMFPRLDWSGGIDWNGNSRIKGDWVLEGDECLVFCLGGIPSKAGGRNGCLGFSVDPRNPAKPGGFRIGPFFEFRNGRLVDRHKRRFFSYLDDFGQQPFAYFSAYGEANGYNRYGGTDCPTLGVWPYAEALGPAPRFLNPTTYQILSAGADGRFGPGTRDATTVWTPATARDIPPEGRDDLSNFHGAPLGVPGR
jgi:hypothetical protein